MATQPHSRGIPYPACLGGWRLPLTGLLALCLFLPVPAAFSATRTITIHYGDANEIAQALDGLVEPGGSIGVYQNKLVINASAANIEELAGIIEILDEAPRSLRITIKSPQQQVLDNGVFKVTRNGRTYRSDGEGNHHTLRNPDGTVTTTRVRLSGTNRGGTVVNGSAATSSIRALEGKDASLDLSSLVAGTGSGVHQRMLVNARVHGEQVTVRIRNDAGTLENGELRNQGLATRTSGKLGQWIPVGSIRTSSKQTLSSYGYAWDTASSARTIYLKVELLE